MRFTLIAAAAALLAGSLTASAQGTEEKFCSQMKASDAGKGLNCSFSTMAKCQETVKAGEGTCIENPKK